jgi:hypothetical protein
MEIRFRELNPFNCWIWLRFGAPLGQAERGYVETLFDSWFFLGKLGLQRRKTCSAMRRALNSAGWATDQEGAERALPALMHNMGVMEYPGRSGPVAGSTWAPVMPSALMC